MEFVGQVQIEETDALREVGETMNHRWKESGQLRRWQCNTGKDINEVKSNRNCRNKESFSRETACNLFKLTKIILKKTQLLPQIQCVFQVFSCSR